MSVRYGNLLNIRTYTINYIQILYAWSSLLKKNCSISGSLGKKEQLAHDMNVFNDVNILSKMM